MVERSIEEKNINFDGDPFTSDFNKKLNHAILDEAGKTALKEGTKVAVCALPFALSACSNSPTEIAQNYFSTLSPNTAGHVLGTVFAIEEAFERDAGKNLFRRGFSIGAKYFAGYGIGDSATQIIQNGGSVLSSDNLSHTMTFGLAVYVMASETKIKQLLTGVGSSVRNSVSNYSQERRQAEFEREVKHIADDAYSINIKKQIAAREKAEAMGISREQLKQIHNQKR
jgi:hypothetical protein